MTFQGNRGRTAATLLLLGAAAAGVWVTTPAGELEPPGPPGPTMKPLSEIEVRRPIYAGMLPLTIVEEGSSWFLAENIRVTGGGITVLTDYVTIDLNGFILGGGTGNGISSPYGYSGLRIRNGRIQDWVGHGISVDSGATIEGVYAFRNGESGIVVGAVSRVVDCQTTNNSKSGIKTGGHTLVVRCRAANNNSHGIETGDYDRIIDCISTSNEGNGIDASSGVLITGCQTNYNDLNGIRVGNHCDARDNHSSNNSFFSPEDKSGIFILGVGNRIDGNHLIGNAYGIRADAGYNTIVRNSVYNNSIQAFFLAAGNDVGPIGTAATATSPWANIDIP